MAKELTEKTQKKINYVDPDTYEWTKGESQKSFQAIMINGSIVLAMTTIWITFGYLLIKKIKD